MTRYTDRGGAVSSEVTDVLFLQSAWPFLLPVIAAFYMFWLAWTRGGDPKEDSATVHYEPPENLSPAECSTLLDNAISPRGIAATIVDLSIKGYFAIEPNDSSKASGTKDNQDYVFHLIKQPSEWNDLKPHERAVLSAIFIPTNPLRMLNEAMSQLQKTAGDSALASAFAGVRAMTTNNPALQALAEAGGDAPRPTVALSESQNHFYLHKTAIGDSVFDAMVAGGYYAGRPDRVRLFYVAKGIVTGALLAMVGSIMPANGTPWFTWILSGALTGLIVSGFGWFMPARTVSGVRALAKVRGFQDFLGKVEKDRIVRLEQTPELFEKYLPYAMALGVESKWAQAFGRITVQPKWRRGPGGDFLPMQLVNNLSEMPNQTGQAMAPTAGAA